MVYIYIYIYSSCSVTRCHEILCPECGLLLRCTLRVILVQTWSKSASLLWPGHSTEWDYHFLLTLSSIHSRRNCLKKLESRQMPQHLDVTHIPGAHAIVEYSWLFTIGPRLSTLSWRASSTNWISFSLLSKSLSKLVTSIYLYSLAFKLGNHYDAVHSEMVAKAMVARRRFCPCKSQCLKTVETFERKAPKGTEVSSQTAFRGHFSPCHNSFSLQIKLIQASEANLTYKYQILSQTLPSCKGSLFAWL